jgi:hypothetical protein
LLASIWRRAVDEAMGALPTGCARLSGLSGPAGALRGLQAYQAHAGALAQRALAAAYPTVQLLLGTDSFAGLARTLWAQQPPQQGDMAQWGDALPAFISTAPSLVGEPYLADVARLDWAVHTAHTAADHTAAPDLQALASHDPHTLVLHTCPGTALVSSAHPVHSIWLAHQGLSTEAGTADVSTQDTRYAAVQQAFASGLPQHALVHRSGWQVAVLALPAQDAPFTAAVLAGTSLGAALDAAGPAFDFEAWLLAALKAGWLVSAQPVQR